MRYKAYNAADSGVILDDEFIISCTLHGEIGRSFWPSVFQYLMYHHENQEGNHEYVFTNERTGLSFNSFSKEA